MTLVLAIAIEATPKKTFVSAVDWPGLARSGKTEELAIAVLTAAMPRYARMLDRVAAFVPDLAGIGNRSVRSFRLAEIALQVVENEQGSSGTAFGVPSRITSADRRAVTAEEADRLVGIVAAAWAEFDEVVAGAPAGLRKGPRGGGRDRDKIVAHVNEADGAYVRARYAAHRIAWHALDHAWEIEDRTEPAST